MYFKFDDLNVQRITKSPTEYVHVCVCVCVCVCLCLQVSAVAEIKKIEYQKLVIVQVSIENYKISKIKRKETWFSTNKLQLIEPHQKLI